MANLATLGEAQAWRLEVAQALPTISLSFFGEVSEERSVGGNPYPISHRDFCTCRPVVRARRGVFPGLKGLHISQRLAMSFRLKIVLGIILIQVLLLLFVVWSNFHFLRTSNEVELNKHASETVALLAATIKPDVLTADRASLQQLSNELLTQPGIVYIRIRDLEGVLVQGGEPAALARPFSEDFLVEDATDGVFDVAAEVSQNGIVFGTIEMGFSTAEIEDVMLAARRQTATISMLGMGVGLMIALMLGNYFARQLKILRDASRRIAAGDVGYQLPVSGNDELAQTARAFNTMSRRLAMLYSEKQAALNEAEHTTVELRASKRRIQAVVNNALDGIVTIDEYGTVESFNPAAERMFGYDADEVVGNNVNMLMPEPYHSAHDGYLQRYLRSGEKRIIGTGRELVGSRKDGHSFPMEVEVSEVQVEGHNLFIAITRDITERKRTEDELRQARDAVMTSSRGKFEFIANISHEIRSPLDRMLGMSSLLLETPLRAEQHDYAERIQQSGKSLLTIINDVLDFSRIEAGQLALESIRFDLHRTLYVVCQMLRKVAVAKGLELIYIFPCGLPVLLRGDPTRLRQILVNLVDNAIKFTARGEVVVRVVPIDETAEGYILRFEVNDTGIGLSSKDQQRIFDAFLPANGAALSQTYGSSGLGLVISRRLVSMMQGKMGVESTPGKGSSFWFTAHFERLDEQGGRFERGDEILQNLRVLIVDDRQSGRDTFAKLLASRGMKITAAKDGAHALDELCAAAVANEPFDLVIFSRMMPGMTGLQLAQAIKNDPRIAATRMILMTSTGYRGDSDVVRRAGIAGYLTMPVPDEQLLDCVTTIMRRAPEDMETLVTRHNLALSGAYSRGRVILVETDEARRKQLLVMLEALDYSVCVAAADGVVTVVVGEQNFDWLLVSESALDENATEVLARLPVERAA